MLEKEIEVSQKLKVILYEENESPSNYSEVLHLYDKDKHPILNRFLSMKARQQEDNDGYC